MNVVASVLNVHQKINSVSLEVRYATLDGMLASSVDVSLAGIKDIKDPTEIAALIQQAVADSLAVHRPKDGFVADDVVLVKGV